MIGFRDLLWVLCKTLHTFVEWLGWWTMILLIWFRFDADPGKFAVVVAAIGAVAGLVIIRITTYCLE